DVDDKHRCEYGRLCYLLGINFYDTDEPSFADRRLISAINIIADKNSSDKNLDTPKEDNEDDYEADGINNNSTTPIDIQYIHILADSYNYLGMLWTSRNEPKRSERYLRKAEEIYSYYKKCQDSEQGPKVTSERTIKRMEELHTLTTFYLAQVYGFLKLPVNAAQYCYLTLVRQLESKLDLNKFDWTSNCLQLAGFLLNEKHFATCEHFIAAAEYMLSGVEQEDQSSETYQSIVANLEMAKSRLYQEHLTSSKEYVMTEQSKTNEDFETILSTLSLTELPKTTIEPRSQLPSFVFPTDLLPVAAPKPFYYLRTFEEALSVFKKGKKAAENSLKYYVLDGFVTEHIANLENLSHMYKLIAFFEPDIDRKCAMQKRRADLLSSILNQLNVEIYSSTLKQISFELGEMYSDVWDLLYKRAKADIKNGKKSTPVNRINETALHSVKYLSRFVSLFEDSKTKQLKVEEENIPAYIRGRLMIARLYYHMTHNDTELLVRYLTASLKEYETIVEFAKKQNPEHLVGVQQEVDMAKQMIRLLPTKIKEERGLK
ncbi:hypothetical protein AKO1_000662, partial [Acrasis kona]